MIALAVLLSLAPLWSKAGGEDCLLSASPKGERTLMACRTADGWQLSLIAPDGRIARMTDVDADALHGVVSTTVAVWSPTGRNVALEIGFDEEPGVFLIDAGESPSAVLIDRALAKQNVSATDPQWTAAGDWLLFRTSGTGEHANEGVYAVRLKDRAIVRLVPGIVKAFTLAGNTLIVSKTDKQLVAFAFDKLAAQSPVVAALRKRAARE